MSKNIAPITESITAGQIGRAAERFSERCRVNASALPKGTAQVVLEDEGDALAQEMFEVFRARVERRSNIIVRRVKVNRTRSPQETLNATARKQYTDRDVVDSMPKGEGDEVDVYFFKPDESTYDKDGSISDDKVARQFDLYGLKPDPRAHAAVNEADPAFADDRPNVTHWKNAEGEWCSAAFDRCRGTCVVNVNRNGLGWGDYWWFAGVRKPA